MNSIKKAIILSGIVLGATMTILNYKNSGNSVLRVAFPAAKSASSYEPTKIYLGHEYIFLENIFSPLVEIDPKDGQITAGIAKSYEWKNDELVLEIRTDSKTVSGAPITAEDVEFSLKRLLVLSGNTHGNFKDLVCPHTELKSINETCEGITRVDEKIILKAGTRKAFLVTMLGAIDFAIIPKKSVDPKTLSIIDYKETSGPYYVAEDDQNGKLTLKANPNHFRYSLDIPQIVRLVPVDPSSKTASLELFEKNEVDHLTTIDQAKAEDVFALAQKSNDVSLHSTHKIRNLSLVFTEKGLNRFSLEERRALGAKVRKAFSEILKNKPAFEDTEEFFSALADGGLNKDEKSDLSQKISSQVKPEITKKIRIGLIRSGEINSWTVGSGKL